MTSRAQTQKDSIDRRRAKVIELVSKGKNLSQISEVLDVDVSTVSRDYQYVKENAAKVLEDYLNETVPLELTKCLSRLNAISDEAWAMAERARGDKEKIAALSLAQKTALQILNVIRNNKDVIDDDSKSIDAVGKWKEEEVRQKDSESLDSESKEPDPARTVF